MDRENKGKEVIREDKFTKFMRKRKKKNFVWSPTDDELMLDMLVDHAQQGNKSPDGKWKEDVWEDVIPRFNALKGTRITLDNVLARIKTWKKTYRIVTALRNESGFVWDDNKKIVEADRDVWDAYIKEHKDAASYKNKACPIYDQLAVVIGNSSVSGDYYQTACNGIVKAMLAADGVQAIEDMGHEQRHSESSDDEGAVQEAPRRNKRRSTTSCSSQPRQKAMPHAEIREAVVTTVSTEKVDLLATSIRELTETMKCMIEMQKKKEEKAEERERKGSDECWYEALKEVPGLDNRLKFGGMELLEKRDRREAFMKMNAAERREWLEWMLSDRAESRK